VSFLELVAIPARYILLGRLDFGLVLVASIFPAVVRATAIIRAKTLVI
jgi:hypothetical protein